MSVDYEVRIPESWEFLPVKFWPVPPRLPVPQPDPVEWLNEHRLYWTPTP